VITTVEDIITAAIGKSSKNRADTLANKAVELVAVVHRSLSFYFSHAATVDPAFFGVTQAVTAVAGVWTIPETAESIYRIEKPDTTEVVVVPYDDKAAEPSKPAVFRFGRGVKPAGNALDPVGAGDLVFYFGKRADKPPNSASLLDPLWVEAYNELPILDVAMYLAKKDGRSDEVATMKDERSEWLGIFEAFIEHNFVNEVRRFGNVRSFNSPMRKKVG
jgi:hypothetical protein